MEVIFKSNCYACYKDPGTDGIRYTTRGVEDNIPEDTSMN